MKIKEFFDPATFTLTYLVFDPSSKDCVIIDPVLDYEPQGSTLSTTSADQVIEFVKNQKLNIHFILETHAHADHITAAPHIKKEFPSAKTALHENIKVVQKHEIQNVKCIKSPPSWCTPFSLFRKINN